MDEVDKKLLKNYVTNIDDDIYVLFNLPPEVIAVLFAYVSRSPNTFKENLLKLIKSKDLDVDEILPASKKDIDFSNANEKARKFHEKWVVGYGHGSVAEHACASVAMENVSILASKVIEDNRLASYTEKSTRYQIYDRNKYYKPKKIMESRHGSIYEETGNMLFDTYLRLVEIALKKVRVKYPKSPDMKDGFYEAISKARACDVVRYLLPAATLTNLGMTANARTYEHAIRKLKSHPLKEMNIIGEKVKTEVQKIIPTLVKYADATPYIKETCIDMLSAADESVKRSKHEGKEQKNFAKIVRYDEDAEDRLITSILFRFTEENYDDVFRQVKVMSDDEKYMILDKYLGKMDRHDWPLREFEHVYYTFEILCDYGAYRDIQRHRICTQSTQLLSTDYGYSIPDEVKEFGMEKEFTDAMDKAKETYEMIREDMPVEAQYIVPLGFRINTLFTWNLRQLFHFIRLRSGKEGHMSYRRIAVQCYDEIKKVHPTLAKYLKVNLIEGPARG